MDDADTDALVTPFVLGHTEPGATTPPEAWIDAVVPGGVHESLVAAGLLAHPYRDRHESDGAWVQERSWWYRATLPPAPGPTELTFECVDTVATVWVDGREVARHASQFRPLVVELEPSAHEATLLVRVDPPLWQLEEPAGPRATRDRMRAYFVAQGALVGDDEPSGVMSADLAMTRRRKALFSWGWDFAPRVPSIGLLGPVRLLERPAARLVDVHWRTLSVEPHGERSRSRLTVHGDNVTGLRARWELRTSEGALLAGGDEDASAPFAVEVDLAGAPLWWPHDLGTPALHHLTVTLLDGDEVVDRHEQRVGLRTVELDRGADDEGGHRFRFVVNGAPTFARGANWVPPSMLPGSVAPEHTRRLVTLARDAGMTMLRVWGGGLYPDETFFDACDELGMLVWQDFMFACVDYPDEDPELRREVAAEAEHQVRRLRAHPSLALWCGNNEASAMHVAIWGSEEPPGWGEHFYDELLPGTVERWAPGTTYWRASPHGEHDPRGANGMLDGDRHAWEVWHGGDLGAGSPPPDDDPGMQGHFWRYTADRGRFISEFGIHAASEVSTLRAWTEEDLSLGSPGLLHRIKDTPKDKGLALLATETGVPTSLESYVAASMAVQAEGLAYGIGHYRRRQPTCSGTLVWQLDEPWPGLTWSVIDHDGVPKAAWYALRRVYAPVVTSLREADGRLEVWVTNSSRAAWSGRLVARVARFAGDVEVERTEVDVDVAAGESRAVATLALPRDGAGRREVFAEVLDPSGQLPRARLVLDHLKHLPLDGQVRTRVVEHDEHAGRAVLEVTARGHAYAVRVEPVVGTRASDGWFDLPDGRTATIEVIGLPAGQDPASLVVRTWADDWGR